MKAIVADRHAQDIHTLRERVTGFLSDSEARRFGFPRKSVRLAITHVIGRIRHAGWDAYLVGGTLRDLMLRPAKAGSAWSVPRDVDIVVCDVTVADLEKQLGDLVQRQTRFGGLHLAKSAAGYDVHFDVWPLHETWAFRRRSLPADIKLFPETPFLNLDSIAISLSPDGPKGRSVYERGFVSGIQEETIEINYEDNPFPDVCLIRALIMAAKLRFSLGERLARFVSERYRRTTMDALLEAQMSHYGKLRCSSDELVACFTLVQNSTYST